MYMREWGLEGNLKWSSNNCFQLSLNLLCGKWEASRPAYHSTFFFTFHILKCEAVPELFIPLQHSMTHVLWQWHTQTTRRSDRSDAVMCVGSTDAQRRQAWVRGWGSGLCAFFAGWVNSREDSQSENVPVKSHPEEIHNAIQSDW